MSELLSNPRGIPQAPFVEKVEAYISGSVEATMAKLDEMTKKYKFMEQNLRQRHASLSSKIPEIRTTLQTVRMLIAQNESGEPLETNFELNDTLFAKAVVEATPTVNIWLGANVMLEYPIAEAEELLATKLAQATTSLQQVDEDLEFLREQITTMEVNVARVYNWDVQQRKKAPKPVAA
ncbi:peptide chain release factor 1 [Blastocladiella emersonii ATCC 22665]|nr:peptide chain release factor 1 [Blastocladiella emersonii ATCC 22665]